MFALAAEHDELGARLDVGQHLRRMAEFKGGRQRQAERFGGGDGFLQEGFAARAQRLLQSIDRAGIPPDHAGLRGDDRKLEHSRIDDVDGFEPGPQAPGPVERVVAGDGAAGRAIDPEEDVFDHGRTSFLLRKKG
jgi:hypothetical protein